MIRDSIRRAREVFGASIVRFGLWVSGFEPLAIEHEEAFAGDESDDAPIAPVELSPRAQAMVEEARVYPPPNVVAPEPPLRRGSIAERIARARAGG